MINIQITFRDALNPHKESLNPLKREGSKITFCHLVLCIVYRYRLSFCGFRQSFTFTVKLFSIYFV